MNNDALIRMVMVVLSKHMKVVRGQSDSETTMPSGQTVSDSEMGLLQALIMRENNCTLEEAMTLIDHCRQKEIDRKSTGYLLKAIGAAVLLLMLLAFVLCVILFSLFSADPQRGISGYVMGCLLLITVVALIAYIVSARRRVMRRLWLRRDHSLQGTKYAMEEMLKVSQRPRLSACNKLVIVCIATVMLLSGILMNKPYVFTPTHIRLYELMNNVESYAQMVGPWDLLMDVNDADKIEEALLKTNEAMLADGKQTLFLAEIASRLTVWNGEDTYMKILQDALSNSDPLQINTEDELDVLHKHLQKVELQTVRTLTDRIVALDTEHHQRFMSVLGSYYGDKATTVELMEISAEFGHQEEFLISALADDYAAQIVRRLDKVESQEHRKLILQYSANNFTAPNDVLKIISKAREHGITAVECYPDGVVIDFDATKLALTTCTEEWPEEDVILPLICVEKTEPLEYKTVPDDMLEIDDKLLELYTEEYEGNAALGKDAFTVWLDTAVLDRMPAEMIPQTIEETQLLMVSGIYYVRSGTYFIWEYVDKENMDGSEEMEILWKRHYPNYAAVQTTDLFDYKTGKLFWRFDLHINESELLSSDGDEKERNEPEIEDVEKGYIGVADPAWLETAKEEMVQRFEKNDWNILVTLLLYELETAE